MRKNAKLKLSILLFLITIVIVLVGLFIKTFYVISDAGKQKITELIVSLSHFSSSVIIVLLFDALKTKFNKVLNYIILVILSTISIFLGIMFIGVYCKYFDRIIDKLVYLSTTNSIDFVNIYSAHNSINAVLNIITLFVIAIAVTAFILIIIKPILNKARIFLSHFILSIHDEVKLLLQNISKGFLYKRVP